MTASPPRTPSFAVLQMGARLHYAVPAALHAHGMLAAFFTDAVVTTPALRALFDHWPRQYQPPPVQRLLARHLPASLPRTHVHAQTGASLALALLSRALPTARLPLSAHALARRALLKANFDGANALYILDNSDLELARTAKAAGMFVVYEQICDPKIGRIIYEERARYPGLESQDPLGEIEAGIARDVAVWHEADLVLAPAAHVATSIADLGGPPDRTVIVPYGIDASWFDTVPSPVKNRVLFVGRVGLPKGAHHFAAAARLLAKRGVAAEFRAVGASSERTRGTELFAGPEYVGIVPRDQIRREFEAASVFVLPTLSDGFGMVLLEAMASGVPVVTTDQGGTVARDGIEGFIVSAGDVTALADRIQRLLTDDTLRTEMGRRARERAREYTIANYGERLASAIWDRYRSVHAEGRAWS